MIIINVPTIKIGLPLGGTVITHLTLTQDVNSIITPIPIIFEEEIGGRQHLVFSENILPAGTYIVKYPMEFINVKALQILTVNVRYNFALFYGQDDVKVIILEGINKPNPYKDFDFAVYLAINNYNGAATFVNYINFNHVVRATLTGRISKSPHIISQDFQGFLLSTPHPTILFGQQEDVPVKQIKATFEVDTGGNTINYEHYYIFKMSL